MRSGAERRKRGGAKVEQRDLLSFFSSLKPTPHLSPPAKAKPSTSHSFSPLQPAKKLRLDSSVEARFYFACPTDFSPQPVLRFKAVSISTPQGTDLSLALPNDVPVGVLSTFSSARPTKRKLADGYNNESSDSDIDVNCASRINALRSLTESAQSEICSPKKQTFATPYKTPQKYAKRGALSEQLSDLRASSPSKPSVERYLSPEPKHQPSPQIPAHLELLRLFFKSLESALAYHASRDIPPTYHRLKKPIENMCNRDFSLQSLCQILAIVPSLFKITPLKVLVDTDIGKKENSLMLEMVGETSPTKENPAENARVTPYKEVLEQRLHLFDSECERLVEIAHDKFLGSLPKSDREYDTTAAKYHPKFKINEDVPEVVGIAIPDVKNVSTQKCIPESTKEDENTFENSDVIVGDDSKLPSDGGSKNCEKTPDEILESPVKPQMSRAAALLERIRAREKAKEDAHNSLKLSPSELKHRAMIGRLVEVARGIMCFFNQKGKTALPMKEVCEYVVTSVRSSVSYEEAREHIVLLAQIMPDLCKVSKLSIGTVVVFSTEMPEIVAKVRVKVKELLDGPRE